jgi:hypothetical protein
MKVFMIRAELQRSDSWVSFLDALSRLKNDYDFTAQAHENFGFFFAWEQQSYMWPFLLTPICAPDRCQTKDLSYSTPIYLEGKLIPRTVFGPPGYGEDPKRDARIKILLLHLPCANVLPAKDSNKHECGSACK